MSQIRTCPTCGGNIVTPAYEGDGAYPVGRMCDCGDPRKFIPPAEKYRRERNERYNREHDDG